ncbi:MAG: hypothetical protein JXB88_00175 [Spirochaetales bacterium]|nr:hypothetical protein [Spirochaetales bacterium]
MASTGYTEERTLSLLIKELFELLTFYFSQNWFLILLEDIPGNEPDMHEILGLLSYQTISLEDRQKLKDIIILLDHLVSIIKRFLLPVIREKLRISGLVPEKQLKDRDERIRNGFIASVFPDNLERISLISDKIKCYLKCSSEKISNSPGIHCNFKKKLLH